MIKIQTRDHQMSNDPSPSPQNTILADFGGRKTKITADIRLGPPWADDVNTYGVNPIKLFIKINIIGLNSNTDKIPFQTCFA